MNVHIKKVCKQKKIKESQIQIELNRVKQELATIKQTKHTQLDTTINNQLINIIMDKNKVIEEMKTLEINPLEIIPKENKTESSLILNNVIILSRIEDNYVNATQLCLAGNKNFNDWLSLKSTKYIINELANVIKNPKSQLIESCKEVWIHPDLSIQLAQWLSPCNSIAK
jgi:hypothetical protein